MSITYRIWKFAKDNLGVIGDGNEEEYTTKLISMENKDQNTRKGKNNSMKIITLKMRGWGR